MKGLKIFIMSALICSSHVVFGQEKEVDLFAELEKESAESDKKKIDFTTATFKTTRLVNGHTVETAGKRILDVKISHRFGTLNKGAYELFGLDNATMRMGVDYGITGNLNIGIGRSTFQKQYDGFIKYKFLKQSTGKINMPVSATLVSSIMLRTLRYPAGEQFDRYFSDRLSFAFQLLVARKFSEGTSLQLMPTVIHYNLVPKATNSNDIFALGIGGRQKLNKRVSINAEYYFVNPAQKLPDTYNSLAIGFDIETGGHVFQLHFTNSTGMTERTFITETTGSWGKGDILFGFNISRVFVIGNKRKAK